MKRDQENDTKLKDKRAVREKKPLNTENRELMVSYANDAILRAKYIIYIREIALIESKNL